MNLKLFNNELELPIIHQMKKSLDFANHSLSDFMFQLEEKGWDLDAVFYGDRGIRFENK